MVISLGVMNTAIATACSSLADGDQLGGLFGVLESVESVAGMVGPTLGGLLAAWYDELPLAIVLLCYAIAFVIVGLFYHQHVIKHAPAGSTNTRANTRTHQDTAKKDA
mmetsp:Transcript_6402/g.16585  ORF Transcript_6402/g.16585 Transcript_6402/m.16585 type:complete len:108 (+) Transcript_6402:98-421(+)